MLFLVSLSYPFLCSSVIVLVPFWSPKSFEISINIWLVGKSADMRLDRAGSIGLRVGPPQIPPKIQKKRVRNPTRFWSLVFIETGAQSEQNELPNGLQNGTKIDKKGGFFGELLRRGSWGLIWEHFGMLWGAFWVVLGSISGRFWSDFGVIFYDVFNIFLVRTQGNIHLLRMCFACSSLWKIR